MAKILINTIVGTAENFSQLDFIKELNDMDLEIDGIEVRGELFSAGDSVRKEELGDIIQITQANQWDLFISHPVDLFEASGLTLEAKEILKEADRYDFKNVKFNTGNPEGILSVNPDTAKEVFHSLRTKVSIENGQNEINGTLQSVEYALKNSQQQNLSLGFTYDMGNWAIMGEDPKEAFEAIKNAITVFHLKNVTQNGETTLLDEGIVSWRELTDLDIPYILEYAMPVDEIANEVSKLKEALSK